MANGRPETKMFIIHVCGLVLGHRMSEPLEKMRKYVESYFFFLVFVSINYLLRYRRDHVLYRRLSLMGCVFLILKEKTNF